MFKRPIKCRFSIIWKHTCWQFPHLQMIGDAFTTNSLTRAGKIGAVAILQVGVFLTLHNSSNDWLPFDQVRLSQVDGFWETIKLDFKIDTTPEIGLQ